MQTKRSVIGLGVCGELRICTSGQLARPFGNRKNTGAVMELFTQSTSAPGRDLGMCVVHSPGKWIGDKSKSNRLRERKRSPAGFVRRCAFVVPVACFRLGSPSRMRSPEQIRAGIESIDSAIRVSEVTAGSNAAFWSKRAHRDRFDNK